MRAPRAHGAARRCSPLATIDADTLRAALARHAGVKARVWRELGLPSRFALRRLLLKYGIDDA